MLTGVMNELSAARTDVQASTWRHLPALQQPAYPDEAALVGVVADLRRRPPLVFAGEVDSLRDLIAQASMGEAFVLMGGDCAESFAHNTADNIRLKVQTILQMAAVLTYGASTPVVKVGRMAGQYAKPRSSDTETRGEVTLPAFRGDSVNGHEFTPEARIPDPARMLDAYLRSGTTLNLIRAFTMGGYADLREVHSWNRGFTANPAYKRFESFAEEIDHGAHVAILAGVHNPVGVKVGPTTSPDDVVRLMDRLNPDGVPGRLSLITRMGADRIRDALPALVEAVRADGRPITWITDPMHGNTITSDNGYKTRRFETILDEIRGFFEVHRSLGTAPGGIHVELTGDDVTEVLGGGEHIDEAGLAEHYETLVDPRLNHQQSLEVAFEIAEMLKG